MEEWRRRGEEKLISFPLFFSIFIPYFPTYSLCITYTIRGDFILLIHTITRNKGGTIFMANRSRDYYRKVRAKEIKRKKAIRLMYGDTSWYHHDGQYSKGKVHCSCPICTYSKFYGFDSFKEKKEKEIAKQALREYMAGEY